VVLSCVCYFRCMFSDENLSAFTIRKHELQKPHSAITAETIRKKNFIRFIQEKLFHQTERNESNSFITCPYACLCHVNRPNAPCNPNGFISFHELLSPAHTSSQSHIENELYDCVNECVELLGHCCKGNISTRIFHSYYSPVFACVKLNWQLTFGVSRTS